MNESGDHVDDMGATAIPLSDDAIEAFITGRPHPRWEADAALVAFDGQIASALDAPTPAIGPALAELMARSPQPAARLAVVSDGHDPSAPALRPAAVPTRVPHRRRRLVAVVVGGLATAASALPVAAATHVLPAPAHDVVVRVLEAVTPFEFTGSRPGEAPVTPGLQAPATPAPVSPAPIPGSVPGAEGAPGLATPPGAAPELSGRTPAAPPASLPAAGARPTAPPAAPAPQGTGQSPAPTLVPPAVGPPATAAPGAPAVGGPPAAIGAPRDPETSAPATPPSPMGSAPAGGAVRR